MSVGSMRALLLISAVLLVGCKDDKPSPGRVRLDTMVAGKVSSRTYLSVIDFVYICFPDVMALRIRTATEPKSEFFDVRYEEFVAFKASGSLGIWLPVGVRREGLSVGFSRPRWAECCRTGDVPGISYIDWMNGTIYRKEFGTVWVDVLTVDRPAPIDWDKYGKDDGLPTIEFPQPGTPIEEPVGDGDDTLPPGGA